MNLGQNIAVGNFWKKRQGLYALKFDGVNDYIQVNNFTQIEGDESFVLETKINIQNTTSSNYFFSTQDDTNRGFAFGITLGTSFICLLRNSLKLSENTMSSIHEIKDFE